ncbi:Glyoxylase, beta-lactamase superfamily II [Micrococcales bacterium KH10]|nr:Glyoxylase, beta-lactamase superfamily II [Micrococcales bacterium KH10]
MRALARSGSPAVAELVAFACGSTTHNTAALLRGGRRETRTYPAGVFLYGGHGRRILFDTGYAPQPWRTGWRGALYRRLLPPRIGPGQPIGEQLDPATVTHVVLSHLHPDHIGGMRYFPHATFVLAAGAARTLRQPRLRDGVLHGLIPSWFDPAEAIIADEFSPGPFGLSTMDVFDDEDFMLVDLPGHSHGHLGALVSGRLLLAGDASWGRDFLGDEARIRAVPRFISYDYDELQRTAELLLRAEANGVTLLFSHDEHPTGVNLL